jgi:hypothetical protein
MGKKKNSVYIVDKKLKDLVDAYNKDKNKHPLILYTGMIKVNKCPKTPTG